MTDERQGGPGKGSGTGGGGGDRDARLRAALRSNIAKRKARAHAVRQPQNPPHGAEGRDAPEDATAAGAAPRRGDD